jgi:ParB-like chromosome segregation protein Spo0J
MILRSLPIFLTLLLSASLWGSETEPSPAQMERQARAQERENAYQLLVSMLGMSEEELALMERTLNRVRALSPEERLALHESVERHRSADESTRQANRAHWLALPEELRTNWRVFIRSLDSVERLEVMARLRTFPDEKRAAQMEAMIAESKAKTEAN